MQRLYKITENNQTIAYDFDLLGLVQLCRYTLEWSQDEISVLSDTGEILCDGLEKGESGSVSLLNGRFLTVTYARCHRCGEFIEVEEELDYPFYCPSCDENLYRFEIRL